MMGSKNKSIARLGLMILLGLALSLPLTACHGLQIVNDPNGECDHPQKPEKPYTDQSAGIYITSQGEVIDKCRALLGHDVEAK